MATVKVKGSQMRSEGMLPAETPDTARPAGVRILKLGRAVIMVREFTVVLALFLLGLVLSFLSPYFLQAQNIFNILRAMSTIDIMSIGQTLIIISGGFDLSVGPILGMTGMFTAKLMSEMGVNPWVAVLGGLTGAVNGLIITRVGINPFVTTLGMLSIARGLTSVIAAGPSNIPMRDPSVTFLGWGQIGPVPLPVMEMFVLVILSHLFLNYTVIGRQIFAVGSNERAARLSGVRVERVRTLMYIIQGVLCAVAGVITVGTLSTAATNFVQGNELDVIAAVIIGGATLGGGDGSIIGAIAGAAIMAVLRNAFVLLGFPIYLQMVTIGRGRIVADLPRAEATPEGIMLHATGGT